LPRRNGGTAINDRKAQNVIHLQGKGKKEGFQNGRIGVTASWCMRLVSKREGLVNEKKTSDLIKNRGRGKNTPRAEADMKNHSLE